MSAPLRLTVALLAVPAVWACGCGEKPQAPVGAPMFLDEAPAPAPPAAQGQGLPGPRAGRYYELVHEAVTWHQAGAAAAGRSYRGMRGRLAIIDCQEANEFVAGMLHALGPREDWKFWIGAFQLSGSEEPAGNWRWINEEPLQYSNWCAGEPNNHGGNEDAAQIMGIPADTQSTAYLGLWNDADSQAVCGYVVEYGP